MTPSITLLMSSAPLSRRHRVDAALISCQTMVSVALRDPHPLVRCVRNRTVANVLSMGLVVLKCCQ